MGENSTDSTIQQKEFEEIDAILPTLLKKGLLTQFDCRIIASFSRLGEKKGAVYSVIMSKPEEEAVILTRAFKKMTEAIHATQTTISLSNTSSNEESNDFTLASKNPFLNNMIIKHLFGYLPLNDMKKFRLVCHQWNSTAEICLRKRATIHFDPRVLLPRTFVEVSKYSHPDLPFPSFAFSSDEDSCWHISELETFFEKWKRNIKEVTFNSFTLVTDERFLNLNYDVTPLFFNPSIITSIIIQTSHDYETQPRLNICLEEFVSIKTLSLSDCIIIECAEDRSTPPIIAPHIINFQNIAVKRNREFVTEFYYNNLVNFSKALNINFYQHEHDPSGASFDLSKQVLKNVNQFHSLNVEMRYWRQAKGDVDFLRLYGTPLERNNLNIKLLDFAHSDIDFDSLSQTVEILYMAVNITRVNCSETLYLPNLKFLCLDMKEIDCLTYFSNCSNLVSLQICTQYRNYPPEPRTFNLDHVPRSVRKMRMKHPTIKFSDNSILHLDSLILDTDFHSNVSVFNVITDQIKSKVLVICHENGDIDTRDIVKLVLANQQAEKILIGSETELYSTTYLGDVSKYFDKKSNFYQFENTFGKSITEEEFQPYAEEEIYFPPYFQSNEVVM